VVKTSHQRDKVARQKELNRRGNINPRRTRNTSETVESIMVTEKRGRLASRKKTLKEEGLGKREDSTPIKRGLWGARKKN